MEQTREELTQNLAERLCWQVARRDDTRVARRLVPKAGRRRGHRLDEGALLDEFFDFLRALVQVALRQEGHGDGRRHGCGDDGTL